MRVIHLDKVGSTNTEARKIAEQGDFGPLWIIADQQSSGRGRRGRDWESPKGNLYCSALFPSELKPAELARYSFVASLATFEALKAVHNKGDFQIKWPNDILLNRAKISGLLLETGKLQHQSWVIVGIGINVSVHPEDTPYPATSLKVHIDDLVKPRELHDILIEKFDHWKTQYESHGFAPIREAWMTRAANMPGPVSVRLPEENFEGYAMDMDENGALQVRLNSGTIRSVHAGDVFLG